MAIRSYKNKLRKGSLLAGNTGYSPTAPFSTTFTYTGADQTWTVPATSPSVVKIKCWGAGGGTGLIGGSPGGYSYGELTVTPGTTYTIVVGAGGVHMGGGAGPGSLPYGGGGQASVLGYGGQGGGLAGVFTGSSTIDFSNSASRTRAVIIAGGGGGGGWVGYSGAGGGTNGVDGSGSNYPGTGGTQSAPGTNPYIGVAGTQMRGGGNASGGDSGGAGGGGGGYYGGGSGWNGDSPSGNSGGGGGSGYIGGVSNATTTAGSGLGAPPNTGDAKYNSTGSPGYAGVLNTTYSGQAVHQGGNALVVIYGEL